tara:strand:+ start:644 stop:1417 length:774 start_codon:yes stop_codon:yes gene_type:complete
MNIFATDLNPYKAAATQLDKHVVKMATESLQMISTIMHYLDIDAPYKPVMLNHPCTIWARETSTNFAWLVVHAHALCEEYTRRYARVHSVERNLILYRDKIYEACRKLQETEISRSLTPFAIAMADKYRMLKKDDEDDFEFAIRSYQHYYLHGKWKFASWRDRHHVARRGTFRPKIEYLTPISPTIMAIVGEASDAWHYDNHGNTRSEVSLPSVPNWWPEDHIMKMQAKEYIRLSEFQKRLNKRAEKTIERWRNANV